MQLYKWKFSRQLHIREEEVSQRNLSAYITSNIEPSMAPNLKKTLNGFKKSIPGGTSSLDVQRVSTHLL